MKKILTDLNESYNELVHKVSWPTKAELASSTVIVMVASLIFAFVIWAVDFIIQHVMSFVYPG